MYNEWCTLQCGECKYFQVDADRREDTTCKRLDHKSVQFAEPWFKSYDCGQFHSNICSEFAPNDIAKWLKDNWTTLEEWIAEYEQAEGKSFFEGKYTVLIVNGDKKVRYYINRRDFFEGNFLNEDGSLKWVKRCYYKQSRQSPTGYEIVWENNF